MNVFCVRPRRFNVGNATINAATRALLRQTFAETLNVVPVPAITSEEEGSLSGLTARTVNEMNLYGQGVVVGGGNLYENGQIDVDPDALACLRPPLLLFSLSYGRIYDQGGRLCRRSDAMPNGLVQALHAAAVGSVARDEATLAHLRSLGIEQVELGGCPTLLLGDLGVITDDAPAATAAPVLLSIREPALMNVPLAARARVHGDVRRMIDGLAARGHAPVHLLCHDKRDLGFASSFGDVPYILPDDVADYLGLLRAARLVVSFRLHAFVPCVSYGTPAVNISYDERSASMVATIGLAPWDVDYLGDDDVVATVLERVDHLDRLERLVADARPRWAELETTMRGALARFADAVHPYAA